MTTTASEPAERLTVNLTARSSRALQSASSLTGDTRTDTVNRALQVYAFIQQAAAEGATFLVSRPGGATEPVRLE
jgi:hypothetical protein